MADQQDEYADGTCKLGKEEQERLVERLYSTSVQQQKQRREELERHYYPVAEPYRLSEEQVRRSVERQAETEVELRRTRKTEAEANATQRARAAAASNGKKSTTAAAPLRMTDSDVNESVKRMYDETLERKKANLEESRRRYNPPAPAAKKVAPEELQEWIGKASKPKKTEFTVDEVNKVYGLSAAEAAPQ